MGHRISIRDIMFDNLDDLFKGEKAGCLYSDPPWGAGNLKYWRTMNEQKDHVVDWFQFLVRIKFLYERHVKGPLFLETGLRFETDLVKVFGKTDAKYEIVYGSSSKKLPNILLCWGAVPGKSPAGMTGFDVPFTVLSSLPSIPQIVFDCCVGLGTTAKVCKKIGAICYANELNRKRAERTMKILDFEQV
jgi:hypothetical protein